MTYHLTAIASISHKTFLGSVLTATQLLAGFFHIPAALLAFVMAGGIAWVAKQLCLDSISGINRQAVDVFGYTTEIILLFVGVLLFTGPSL